MDPQQPNDQATSANDAAHKPEPLFQESYIPPEKYGVLPYEPSADFAAKWMEVFASKVHKAEQAMLEVDDDDDNASSYYGEDDDDVDEEPPPPYESVLATTVTLVSPGKPKVVEVSPPASIRDVGSTRSAMGSSRPGHSRSSSYFSEPASRSRPSSSYSNATPSIDCFPDTPASSVSVTSLAWAQPVKRMSFSMCPTSSSLPPPPPLPPRNVARRMSDSDAGLGLVLSQQGRTPLRQDSGAEAEIRSAERP